MFLVLENKKFFETHVCSLSTMCKKFVCFTSVATFNLTIPQLNGEFCSSSTSSHHVFLNLEGHWGATDDFTSNFLHFPPLSTALWDLANSRPVHPLMLSSHLFLCLPSLHSPFTVPRKMVLARPDELEICPYRCSLHLFTMVRRSSCCPIACRWSTKC